MTNTKEYIIERMYEYDFKNNSINSFAKIYNISSKAVSKYLKEYSIPYNKKIKGIKIKRDNFGKFCLDDSCIATKSNQSHGNIKNIVKEKKPIFKLAVNNSQEHTDKFLKKIISTCD